MGKIGRSRDIDNAEEVVMERWKELLTLAVFAAISVGIETVLINMEKSFGGDYWQELKGTPFFIHMAVICLIWIFLFRWLLKEGRKQDLDIFGFRDKPQAKGVVLSLLAAAVMIAIDTLRYGTLKPAAELQALGIYSFAVQYIYYVIEMLLMGQAIAFGQEAGEIKLGREGIPWGGLLLAGIWGVTHFFTKGITAGLFAMLFAVIYGWIYLRLGKNLRYFYPLALIAFLL